MPCSVDNMLHVLLIVNFECVQNVSGHHLRIICSAHWPVCCSRQVRMGCLVKLFQEALQMLHMRSPGYAVVEPLLDAAHMSH